MKGYIGVLLALTLILGVAPLTVAENKPLGIIKIGSISDIDDSHPIFMHVREAYRMIGYEATLLLLPYERSEYEANLGRFVDAELARTAEAEPYLPNMTRLKIPLETDQISVFTTRQDLIINDWTDLQGLEIDTVRGMTVITRRLREWQTFTEIGSVEQVFQRLESGRSDVAILPGNMAEFVLQRMGISGIYRLYPGLEELALYHYIHRHHAHLEEPLSNALHTVLQAENLTPEPSKKP